MVAKDARPRIRAPERIDAGAPGCQTPPAPIQSTVLKPAAARSSGMNGTAAQPTPIASRATSGLGTLIHSSAHRHPKRRAAPRDGEKRVPCVRWKSQREGRGGCASDENEDGGVVASAHQRTHAPSVPTSSGGRARWFQTAPSGSSCRRRHPPARWRAERVPPSGPLQRARRKRRLGGTPRATRA